MATHKCLKVLHLATPTEQRPKVAAGCNVWSQLVTSGDTCLQVVTSGKK